MRKVLVLEGRLVVNLKRLVHITVCEDVFSSVLRSSVSN